MKRLGFGTRAIHRKTPPWEAASHAISTPIYQTASFAFDSLAEQEAVMTGEKSGFGYSRAANPTVRELELALSELEGAEASVALGSGVAAIHAVLAGLCTPGDHVIAPRGFYGGSYALLEQVMAPLGVRASYVDATSVDAFADAMEARTKLILAETITNPRLDVMDLPALARVAHATGARLMVDATFTSPYLSRPLELGADYVVHSATKYLGGHGDVIAGIVSGSQGALAPVRRVAVLAGSTLAPFGAWLVLRGLSTLALRMERHCRSALAVASAMSGHPAIAEVRYPGLPGHPAYGTQLLPVDRAGGVVGLELVGGRAAAERMIDRLELFLRAGSLGDAHSLVSLPSMTSHRPYGEAGRRAAGISEGYVRLSVGLEDPEDLIADLDRALAA